MDLKTEIGRRLKNAREACNLSLEELSKKTNGLLSKPRIGNYEQGIRRPKSEEALILGNILGVDAAYLLCVDQRLNKQEQDLLKNFRALPEKERNDYQRRIQALALVYREPVPDEKLGMEWASPEAQRPQPPPKKVVKKRQNTKKQ